MSSPNILFLMTDQMQARVLEPDNPCQTPNLDRLAAAGVRFRRAYTPNAVCSPARASLMTGLLPHNHGVLFVEHTVDADQARLRTPYLHWADQLTAAGYHTGYFGKWHVERSNNLARFGWQNQGALLDRPDWDAASFSLERHLDGPPGYRPNRFYGVCDLPADQRGMGKKTGAALAYLDTVLAQSAPWCCFVSFTEPHDPFYCHEDAFAQYDVDSIPLQPNVHNDLRGQPNLYKRAAQVWRGWTDREHREAAACYYASISEIDQQFGRLLDRVERAGQLENTIVVMTSDHGELLGAHGLYCKNIGAFEEAYNIPLVVAGPGVAESAVSDARVGLQDIGQTLLELTGAQPLEDIDGASFAPVLASPHDTAACRQGFAEYYGGRYILTQRILWDGDWKFVHNGFDYDELYNLAADPFEMNNLAQDPAQAHRIQAMTRQMWCIAVESEDHSLANTHYPPLRIAAAGPGPVGRQSSVDRQTRSSLMQASAVVERQLTAGATSP